MKRELEEIWKPIKGFEEFYLITKDGNIKSVERQICLKTHSYIRREQDIIQAKSLDGYYRIKLYNNTKKTKTISTHRLVALTYLNNPNNYLEINHIDGNKTNNNVTNLEWCSKEQNVKHAYDTGLKKRENYVGEACVFSKLTEQQVLSIREEYKTGTTSYPKLSKKYNTVIGNIESIINRKTWKHV